MVTDTVPAALVTVERVHAAREIADDAGIDLLVLTPGSDLRYLSLALARRVGAELVIANDPDADRLAVAVPDPSSPAGWRALTGDELGALLADHLLRTGTHTSDDVLVTTVVSSRMLRAMATEAGIRYVETLTGFKWVARAPLPGHPLILGYEEALGYCVGDVVHDKDGIGALLVAAEMVSELRGTVESVLGILDGKAPPPTKTVNGEP